MSISAITRMKHMCKRQKAIKGLKFGDRQNLIDDSISTEVNDELDLNIHELDESYLIQHEIQIEDHAKNNNADSNNKNSVEIDEEASEIN